MTKTNHSVDQTVNENSDVLEAEALEKKARLLFEHKFHEDRRAHLEAQLRKAKQRNYRVVTLLTSFISTILISFLFFRMRENNYPLSPIQVVPVTLAAFGLILGFLSTIFRYKSDAVYNSTLSQLSDLDVEDLQKNIEEDFFTKLVKINFKYIDKYYLQTQIQANNSFILSVAASSIAFAIIVSGIVLMYIGSFNSAIIATSAGVLSEFVGAVFFYLYNKTIVKMGEYHHKLVITQNISLALKITEQMEGENRVKAQFQLIDQLTCDINKHLVSKIVE